MDRPSIYNITLGWPTFNTLKAVVSTFHLAMKFPTSSGVGVFRGNQEWARKCYLEAVNKVCHKAPAPAVVMTIFKVDEIDASNDKVRRLRDLDPWIPEKEIRADPLGDLVPYQLDPEYPERTVMLGSGLNPDFRVKLQHFLRDHHEDMPGIDLAVICYSGV